MAKVYNASDPEAKALLSGASCAFGVFDGVHVGHRFLIDQAIACPGCPSVVLTFDSDPDEFFRPDHLKKLMTNETRIRRLSECGVDAVVVLPFTHEFASLLPDRFLEETFSAGVPREIHVGYDIRYGRRAVGTADDLAQWAAPRASRVVAHDLFCMDGAPVTATRIRILLEQGDVENAEKLLGHAYTLSGIVERGRQEGRDMGFRTANLRIPAQLQAIGDGVYAAYADVAGARYKAAVSVGLAPTFGDAVTATCEVHLIDFEGDLYGKPIEVEFRQWLRPMMKFSSVDVLIETVMGNIQWVKDNL